MKRERQSTRDGIAILHRHFVKTTQDLTDLDEARVNAKIAREIYELRSKAGMSQRQLARLVGTTASVICRLEDADYEGHSLGMLQRIANVLNRRVEIRFVAKGKAQHAPA